MIQLRYPLILASASPRRKEILSMAGIDCEVVPSEFEEPKHSDHLTAPEVFAEEMAIGKGQEVFERLQKASYVLSADTLGLVDELVLEKPVDREDAERMLKLMSGREHTVLTVVALFSPGEEDPIIEQVKTTVKFRELSPEILSTYLDQAQYMDKAAAYAIQGRASVFVEHIAGEYFNVVGLPIATVWNMLKKAEEKAVSGFD